MNIVEFEESEIFTKVSWKLLLEYVPYEWHGIRVIRASQNGSMLIVCIGISIPRLQAERLGHSHHIILCRDDLEVKKARFYSIQADVSTTPEGGFLCAVSIREVTVLQVSPALEKIQNVTFIYKGNNEKHIQQIDDVLQITILSNPSKKNPNPQKTTRNKNPLSLIQLFCGSQLLQLALLNTGFSCT